MLVESCVYSHILCSHHLLGELADLLDGPWGTLLEGAANPKHSYVNLHSSSTFRESLSHSSGLKFHLRGGKAIFVLQKGTSSLKSPRLWETFGRVTKAKTRDNGKSIDSVAAV